MSNKQLSDLRAAMKRDHIAAIIIPGTDPHGSEYIAPYWQERQYISGFTGSAGTLAIAANSGGLWTDSRYFLQGEQQLEGSGIALMKEGVPSTPTIAQWLSTELKKGDVVAVNPMMFSINNLLALQSALHAYVIELSTNHDLIFDIWSDRPALPQSPVRVLSVKQTGLSTADKLVQVRHFMAQNNINALLLTALDDIAWLMNIRGNDIAYNPVVIAYAIVYEDKAVLFIDSIKLTNQTLEYLHSQGVTTADYTAILNHLQQLSDNICIGIDFSQANFALYQAVRNQGQIMSIKSPIVLLKGIKNRIELSGFRRAMLKDGVALVRFFRWLEQQLPTGTVTELSAAEYLHRCREEQENFVSESFNTISAYGEHGAIVHYSANEQTNALLKPEGFFLLDSGGQYLEGTTDITRTVALGKLSSQQKRDYTLVLKGHLALSAARFPVGTRGVQLDVLARQFLWADMLQFGHGTGHGVGHFLCVHEGPHSIRMNENPTTLQAGMVVSNEPGLYRTGKYGIRTENLLAVKSYKTSDFGPFLCFETLTLFPYDLSAIDKRLLSKTEIRQINDYHHEVYKKLASELTKQEQAWLKQKTKPIA